MVAVQPACVSTGWDMGEQWGLYTMTFEAWGMVICGLLSVRVRTHSQEKERRVRAHTAMWKSLLGFRANISAQQ